MPAPLIGEVPTGAEKLALDGTDLFDGELQVRMQLCRPLQADHVIVYPHGLDIGHGNGSRHDLTNCPYDVPDLVPSVEGFAAWQSTQHFTAFRLVNYFGVELFSRTVGITSCRCGSRSLAIASGGPAVRLSHIVSHGWVSIHVDFSYYIGLVSCRADLY